MKKKLLLFILNLICSCIFAGGYEDSKTIDANKVANFNITLQKEIITVSTHKGNDIHVISETNDKSIFPIVELENNTLIIRRTEYQLIEKGICYISLMLPEKYTANNFTLTNNSGKLHIKQLNAKSVSLNPGPNNLLENITADYFEIPIPDEADVNITYLDCKEIKISLVSGNLNISLRKIPEKKSHISSKHGNLNVSFPTNEKFTINTKSFNSKCINNLNNSVTNWIREGNIYKHNGGDVEIELQTYTGDIIIDKTI